MYLLSISSARLSQYSFSSYILSLMVNEPIHTLQYIDFSTWALSKSGEITVLFGS